MTQLAPKPGFNPLLINWGAPDQARTMVCSYCGDTLPDQDAHPDFVPLILWNDGGWTAEFCDHCQNRCFGLQSFPDPMEPNDDFDR